MPARRNSARGRGGSKNTRAAVGDGEPLASRGPDSMSPPTAFTVSCVAHHRSRLLISDSRARIASAQALIQQSRQSMARQSYVRIVCARFQKTIRFERVAVTARGQISHSICFPCFADVFQELDLAKAFPPVPTQAQTAPRAPYLRLVL